MKNKVVDKVEAKGGKIEVKKMGVRPLPLMGDNSIDRLVVEGCKNLRQGADGRGLVAVGCPLKNEKLSALPLETIGDGEGGRLGIVMSGNRLRGVDLYGDASSYDLGGVTGTVADVVMTGEDKGVVMTDVKHYELKKEAGKWAVGEHGKYPVLHFEATDVMRLSAEAEERELEGSYNTRSEKLIDADADRLKKDLIRGYEALADKTTRGGMELQPVLARYRLEGEGGEVLYRSPIVQVGAPSGVQCAEELRCELSDDLGSRGVIKVSADVYKLRLRSGSVDSVSAGRVKRLVVETSLPVHLIDGNVMAANVLEASGTNGVALRCFLPGASVTMVSARGYAARQLMRLGMKGDASFREALVVNNPFAAGAVVDLEVKVARDGIKGVEAEIEAVDRVLRSDVAEISAELAKCRVPNEFVAESGSVVGGYAVWGGITVKGFQGYGIEAFATTVSSAGEEHSWRAVVVTELATGAKRVATSWGTEFAPLKLSPILSYPRADAVKMTIVVERDGVVYKGEFALSANENRTGAYYFNGTGGEIELAEVEESFAYIGDENVEERYPSMVVVATAGNPLDALSVEKAGRGGIVKVLGVDRRGSAWEFGRHRVYVMTDAGIYLLSVGANGAELRCNRVDRRGVASRVAVAETDDDRWPVVGVASGDLIGLSRGNVATLEEGVDETVVGWDCCCKELWLVDADGGARVKESVGGGWREVEGLVVAGLRDTGSGLLIESDSGVRDTALGEEGTAMVGYRLRLDMAALEWYRGDMRLRNVGLELWSRDVSGVLRVVARTPAEGDGGRVGEMAFVGEVNTPLLMSMRGCRGSVVEVEMSGEMASGSELREVIVEWDKSS